MRWLIFMRRFFSGWRLGITAYLLVLWSWVWLGSDSRVVLQQHLRAATVPRNFDYSVDLPPMQSLEWQMANAQEIGDDEQLRALVEANPRNPVVLAIYLRRNHVLPRSNGGSNGPLDSSFPDWSVRIRDANTVLPGSPEFVAPQPRLDLHEYLKLARRGQQLEPQNTYFDWMEMTALVALGRPRELDAVARRAARKTVFDDHGTDELRARIAYFPRQKPLFEPAAKVSAFSGLLLPHLSPIRNVTRSLAQRVMGLRLQKRDDEALALGINTMRVARLMRLQSSSPLPSQVGLVCEAIAMRSARVPLGAHLKYNFQSPVSALASDPGSLLFLANGRSPATAREIAGEWAQLRRWNVLSSSNLFADLVKMDTIEGVDWTTRAASYLAVSLPVCGLVWFVLTALSLWRREAKPVADAPRAGLWGAFLGLGLLGAFGGFEWIVRALALRSNPPPGSFCGTGMVWREEILFSQNSLLAATPFIWGAVALLLAMGAWRAAFAAHRTTGKTRREPRPKPTVAVSSTLPIDVLWSGVSGIWKGAKWLLRLMLPVIVAAVAAAPLAWPGSDKAVLASIQNGLAVALFVALWFVFVWLGEVVTFARSRRRVHAPALFLVRWRGLLGGFLTATLCVLPWLLVAQTHFTRDFNREFAPVEAGQMVTVMVKPPVPSATPVAGCL